MDDNTETNQGDAQEVEQQMGILQLLPMHVDVNLTVNAQIVSLLPWQSVAMAGIRGTMPDGPHTEQLLCSYEWPMPYFVANIPLTKEQKEQVHLSRFCTDGLLATGTLPYLAVETGANPPDFVCTNANTTVGLDCTQFTLPSRQMASGLFEKIRGAVLRQPRNRFIRLRGSVVYMWFRQGQEQGLPFRINDEAAIQEVVAALENYCPDFERLKVAAHELPQHAPDLDLEHTTRGCTFYAVPMVNAVPNSNFFNSMGFELGYAYTTRHNREAGWREIARLINKHDKPNIDHLLITVGGPNELGFGFISEEVLMSFMLEQPAVIEAPKHLSHVIIHVWGSGGIFQIVPTFQVITPALYPAGFAISHHTAVTVPLP